MLSIRRLALVSALALSPAGAALAHGGQKHDEHPAGAAPAEEAPAAAAAATPSTTLTGEVMDLACYVQHPATGQGATHAGCAKQCISKGLPAGLKVGDKLYLLMAKGHGSLVDQVAPLAGKNASITGKVIESGGMSTLVVESVSPAP
jgi:hypothetical protein